MNCPYCDGTGQVICKTCHGTGWVGGKHGGEICCGGTDDCPYCDGTGELNEEEVNNDY